MVCRVPRVTHQSAARLVRVGRPSRGRRPAEQLVVGFAGRRVGLDFGRHTSQYYLHSYAIEQPDLNWRNPAVRETMIGVLRFWLDRGVDGFRVDAIHRLIKDPTLARQPARGRAGARTGLGEQARRLRHIDQPGVHHVIRELRAVLSDYEPEPLLLGEVGVADPERWAAYYGDGDELTLTLNFVFWSQPWSRGRVSRRPSATTTETGLRTGAWPVWALGNHDIMRLATRYGQDGRGPLRARAAAMMLLTLRGTPLLYYGDEIGMTDVSIPPGAPRISTAATRPEPQCSGTPPAAPDSRPPAVAADPGQRPHRQRRRRAGRTRLAAEPVP